MHLILAILATLTTFGAEPNIDPSPLPSALPTSAPVSIKLTAKIKRLEGEFKLIKFKQEFIDLVNTSDPDGGGSLEATLKGESLEDKQTILYTQKPLELSSDHQFEIKLNLNSEITPLTFSAIQEDGSIQEEKFEIQIENWVAASDIVKQSKPFKYAASVGVSSINYNQSFLSTSPLRGLFLTGKLGVDYRLGSAGWKVGLSGFYNILPLSGLTSATQFAFLGVNLRVGKTTGILKGPWKLIIAGGLYYITTLNSTFGFRNVSGPQIYPNVIYTFNNGATAGAYVKYSPVSSGLSLLNLQNYELAAGASYTFPTTKKYAFFLSTDFSLLSLSIVDNLGSNSTIQAQTITFSTGVTL